VIHNHFPTLPPLYRTEIGNNIMLTDVIAAADMSKEEMTGYRIKKRELCKEHRE